MHLAERQLAREAYRRFVSPPVRTNVARIGDMLATRFDKQLAVIHSKAKRKALLCTRRAGKTESCAAYLLKAAEEHPDCVIVYVGPTLGRARELMWKPLKKANEAFAFEGRPHETLLTLYMPNGAEVRLTGADKLKEAEKKRGDKLALVVIDEASVYPADVLKALIDDVFGPALEDVRGTICVMGTPGIVCAGKWWEMTREERESREAGWEVFQWSVLDNPFMAHMRERLPELKRERGWADDNPTYLREWCGRWVNDTGALFYKYNPRLNSYGKLPTGHAWFYVGGVDLGTDDAFAYSVLAYSPTSPVLYEVESFAESGLVPTQWFEKLREAQKRFDVQTWQVDTGGLGKAIVLDAQPRYPDLPLERAEKKDKPGAVSILNDDLQAGLFQVLPDGVAQEWKVLPKDADNPEAEDERFPNHRSDATLYAHRKARHFLGRTPETPPKRGTPEAAEAEAKHMEEALETRLRAQVQEAEEEEVFGFANESWGDDFEGF